MQVSLFTDADALEEALELELEDEDELELPLLLELELVFFPTLALAAALELAPELEAAVLGFPEVLELDPEEVLEAPLALAPIFPTLALAVALADEAELALEVAALTLAAIAITAINANAKTFAFIDCIIVI
ncbi:MAG: hypothetical protein PHF35_02115 [Candidatus Moranbacteria bacterium]|nr:hypothetical protein [Candidatus Moranbacteria bacterium]